MDCFPIYNPEWSLYFLKERNEQKVQESGHEGWPTRLCKGMSWKGWPSWSTVLEILWFLSWVVAYGIHFFKLYFKICVACFL